jgi:hypothetical protein
MGAEREDNGTQLAEWVKARCAAAAAARAQASVAAHGDRPASPKL